MLRSHSVAKIRAAEEIVGETSGWDHLMQTAAAGLAENLSDIPAGELVLMLIGPGNNGGDALFAATHLLNRGVRVDLALLDENKVHQAGLSAAQAAGAQIVSGPAGHRWVVDGLFGIGSHGGLEGLAAQWAEGIDDAFVIAVDVPSGIGVDTGRSEGIHIWAQRTVTFGTLKNCHLVSPAANACGEIRVVDIGLSPHLGEPDLEAIDAEDGFLLDSIIPIPEDHKYTRGVVGVAAGSAEYAGAAHLCVAGALAGTAGMVRFMGTPELTARVIDRAPEVVGVAGQVQAWVIGSGGGADTEKHLAAALGDEVPCVVDAQALRFMRPAGQLVLTPHAGELAQMLDCDRGEIEADPLHFARLAAEKYGATVLLKGARSLIATPGHPTRVNLSGNPWLATAGSGDVLAGFIGSLLASGMDTHEAASVGAYLHGFAADLVGGPMRASDIAEMLPIAFTEWGQI